MSCPCRKRLHGAQNEQTPNATDKPVHWICPHLAAIWTSGTVHHGCSCLHMHVLDCRETRHWNSNIVSPIVKKVSSNTEYYQGSFRAGTHRNTVPVLFLITGTPFQSFSAYSCKIYVHLNESDKFALFGSKMPSASGGFALLTPWPGALPLDPTGGTAPRPPYRFALPCSPYS